MKKYVKEEDLVTYYHLNIYIQFLLAITLAGRSIQSILEGKSSKYFWIFGCLLAIFFAIDSIIKYRKLVHKK